MIRIFIVTTFFVFTFFEFGTFLLLEHPDAFFTKFFFLIYFVFMFLTYYSILGVRNGFEASTNDGR